VPGRHRATSGPTGARSVGALTPPRAPATHLAPSAAGHGELERFLNASAKSSGVDQWKEEDMRRIHAATSAGRALLCSRVRAALAACGTRPRLMRGMRAVIVTALSLVVFASVTALASGSPPWGGPPGSCVPPGQGQGPPGGQYGPPGGQYGGGGGAPPTDQYTPPGAGSGPPGQPSGVPGTQYGCPPGLQYGASR